MVEKRFTLAEDSDGLFSIFDNEDMENEPLIYGAKFGTERIVDLLNELSEENKKLAHQANFWHKKYRQIKSTIMHDDE